MMLTRRTFLTLSGAATAGSMLAGCRPGDLLPAYPALGSWPETMPPAAWRGLNRVTFGPRPAERQRVADIGLAAFIEEQLAPASLPEMDTRPWLTLRRLETLDTDAADLFDVAERVVKRELQQATLLRAIYSPRQLLELMVDFWSNHFNIDQNKGDCARLKTVDDRAVIRPHALGNFRELLAASAHSPAMLFYLDNQENHAGNPNENYARELLELHTVGLHSGYSQTDIQELARCLTGWTLKKHFYRGEFTFKAARHDDGPKQIMGVTIPAGLKQAGGERMLDFLADHPATARFIATKLARRFVADEPPPQLVAQAAQTFYRTDGDIKAVLRAILLSPEMLQSTTATTGRKLKRPLEFVAGALRQLNARTNGGPPVLQFLAQMGQPLFQWPTPDGFPDRTEAWQGSLLTRWRFALALANDEIPGTTIDWNELLATRDAEGQPFGRLRNRGRGAEERALALDRLATLLLGQPLPALVADQLSNLDERLLTATLISSPAFQWR